MLTFILFLPDREEDEKTEKVRAMMTVITCLRFSVKISSEKTFSSRVIYRDTSEFIY